LWFAELGHQRLWKRPARAVLRMLKMPLDPLLRRRPFRHLVLLMPIPIHPSSCIRRCSHFTTSLLHYFTPSLFHFSTAPKTPAASRALAREAAAGGLLGLDWRPSRFRECQSRDGIPPPGLTWGWGLKASGLSHLTYETTGIVTLHQLDQPPFPCNPKLLPTPPPRQAPADWRVQPWASSQRQIQILDRFVDLRCALVPDSDAIHTGVLHREPHRLLPVFATE